MVASRRPSSPGTKTWVSCWPETTWALVATRPLRTTQPDPRTPSPQDVPSMRSTLPCACEATGLRRTLPSGSGRRPGPSSRIGSGSNRSSVRSTGSGGIAWTRAGMIADACTVRRSPSEGWFRKRTAATHASASATSAADERAADAVGEVEAPASARAWRARRRRGCRSREQRGTRRTQHRPRLPPARARSRRAGHAARATRRGECRARPRRARAPGRRSRGSSRRRRTAGRRRAEAGR